MEFNPEIIEILRSHRINKDLGLLFLLGVYHNLDVDTICDEATVKAMAVTKIVEKDYQSKTINWNVPLFDGQETAFGWVKEWIDGFGKINPDRRGSFKDAVKRMKDFFSKYPQYRKDDVFNARDLYFSSLSSSKYCMHSHKFIFDGMGAMKKSTLLSYCERVTSESVPSQQKGKVIS